MRPTWASLGQTVAVSVATILGTGILALPVSLSRSGIQPFLLLFTLNLFAQIAVVYATTELLQRALQLSTKRESTELISSKSQTKSSENAAAAAVEHTPMAVTTSTTSRQEPTPPSLHSLADYFLHTPLLRWMFNLFVMSHFIFILVAYVLAAPQAYAAIFPFLSHIPVFVHTTVFLFLFSFIVYALTALLLPALSIATLLKAVLLVALVLLTFARGLTIRRISVSDWSLPYLVDPLLMGTMALSGVVNLMPVTFQACLYSLTSNPSSPVSATAVVDHAFVTAYRSATIAGVFICYVLNIVWVYAVLLVVPQSADSLPLPIDSPLYGAVPNVTLENASNLGEISTIPLMEVLEATHDRLNFIVAILVNTFIAVSLTISFLVISIGMLHFIKGSVSHVNNEEEHDENVTLDSNDIFVESGNRNRSRTGLATKFLNSAFVRYWVGGVGFIYVTAILNPKGVLRIMEGVTSFALNVEAGIFVVYMLYTSRLTAEDVEEGSHNTGLMSRKQAAVVITYMVMFFSVAVFVDGVFYLPTTIFGR